MTDAVIISPQEDLIEKIAGLLNPPRKDYSRNLIVFPGRRPAHFLRRELARKGEGSFIPPLILSMDDFIDYVVDAVCTVPTRNVETVDSVAVLYQIHKKSPEPLGGKNFLTLDSFFPLGIKLFKDIEELYIEGVPSGMVKEIQPFTDEMIPEHAQERLQSLHYFYKTFYEEMSRRSMATRSMKYRMAADTVLEGCMERFEKFIFAGFYALTRSEKDLFRRLLQDERAVFIFQDGPGLGDRLAELGMEAGNERVPGSGPEIHFYSSPDTHGQVFALGNLLSEKSAEKRMNDERTTIVLPSSETLFPLLRQGMTCIDKEDFNISLGYPLHRTPVFGFLNNLMELIGSMEDDRVYLPHYMRFVLHPYVKNIYYKGNAGITRIMFHTMEEILQQSSTRSFASLAQIESNEVILNSVREKLGREEESITVKEIREHLSMLHLSTIGKFLFFRDIGDFAARCAEILTFIFRNSTAGLHPFFRPFAESFVSALDAISKSLMKDMSFADRTSYFSFFRTFIMMGRVPFPGTPLKGIQVLGFLETRNIKFDTVFILDANEEVIPATSGEDTLLPFKAREILKLPTYRDRDRLSAYYFENLVMGAGEVHIFFVENDTRERSRFVESLLWERQKKERSTSTDDYIKSVQYKVKLGNEIPDGIVKSDGVTRFLKNFTYSATALDIYLGCPLHFYYRYVLGLGRKEEMTGEIERADIGKFVHGVLSSYFSGRLNRVLKEEDVDPEEMDDLIDYRFSREYGRNSTGAAYLVKTQIKRHLRDYLSKYRVPLVKEKEVSVIGVEESIEAVLNGFRIKGRLDMVEKIDSRICIVDYKTGSSADNLKINFDKLDPGGRDSWPVAIGSLQLPFYLLLYSERHGVKMEDLRGMFLLLGRSATNREIELPLFETGEEKAKLDILKRVIFGLLKEICDAGTPFGPASNTKDNCPRCDFRYICGTQWVTN